MEGKKEHASLTFPRLCQPVQGPFLTKQDYKVIWTPCNTQNSFFFTSHHVPALKGVPGFTHQRYSVNSVILLSEKAPGHTPAIIQAESRSRGFDTVGLRNQKTSEGVVQRHVSRYWRCVVIMKYRYFSPVVLLRCRMKRSAGIQSWCEAVVLSLVKLRLGSSTLSLKSFTDNPGGDKVRCSQCKLLRVCDGL